MPHIQFQESTHGALKVIGDQFRLHPERIVRPGKGDELNQGVRDKVSILVSE